MSDARNVLAMIAERDVAYVDLRFTDLGGAWRRLARPARTIDEATFAEGVAFDGSPAAGWPFDGWREADAAGLTLMPDPASAVPDPFPAQSSLVVICEVARPGAGEGHARDPRATARRAEAHLANTGVGDSALFGPELEFFVFDDVRYGVTATRGFYEIESAESTSPGGDAPVPPVDSSSDLRAEMLTLMAEMGVAGQEHRHGIAPAQNNLTVEGAGLLRAADCVQIGKYVARNVAHSYGKTATFMPKPLLGENGSSMRTHQSLWKAGKPLFAGGAYAGLSELALFYIGGIIAHARAINAFANPTTNSYKRLAPGAGAPVLLGYSAGNRSAACRVPHAAAPGGTRLDIRLADPSANPYLAFAAMLMAGLDGIENETHPGEPLDESPHDLAPEASADAPSVCASLDDALDALDSDRDFLKAGNVFTDDLIDGYLALKRAESHALATTPHPMEFMLYYGV